jgi:hypothetical protein
MLDHGRGNFSEIQEGFANEALHRKKRVIHIISHLRNPACRQAGLRFISEPLRENLPSEGD